MTLSTYHFNTSPVRSIIKDGEPWFVAADVCGVLSIANIANVIAALDDDEKGLHTMDTPGGPQLTSTVSESGLYSLILRSRKPEAKSFKRWVTHEVLPQIRKTGAYSAAPALPKSLPEALRAYAAEVEQREALQLQVEADRPKVEFFDAVTASDDVFDMNRVAKLLGVGRNKLMAEMREMGLLLSNNSPAQEYIDRGYFRLVEGKYEDSKGVTHLTTSTKVYQKGVDFLRKWITANPLPE